MADGIRDGDPAATHAAGSHDVGGSPREQMRRILARHLCGWLTGHSAPLDHFLADADLIMRELDEHKLRVIHVYTGARLAEPGHIDSD